MKNWDKGYTGGYYNPTYSPKSCDVILHYYAKPAKGVSLRRLCDFIAGESSIGTWTKVSTMNPTIAKKLKPHVFHINEKTGFIKIAYPEELFEPGNIAGILSSIAGNIYGMESIANLRLQDIQFTKKIIKSFEGPQFGISGIRKLTKVKNRPWCGTIVKPKVGLTSLQHSQVANDAWSGGLDIVKDDENLTSMSFNSFDERMSKTFKVRDKVEKETGEKKIYLANITAECDEMKRRADVVSDLGGEYIMIDILTCGWSAVHTMRKYAAKKKLAIHAHRAMHGALTRLPYHGISMLVLAKISRLVGVDTLHIGTAGFGKMHSSKQEELHIEDCIQQKIQKEDSRAHVLGQNWHGLKPVIAVASGGVSPLAAPGIVKAMGNDIVIQGGGGVHGNPLGTRGGAKAMREAVEIAGKGGSYADLRRATKDSKELKAAFDKWA